MNRIDREIGPLETTLIEIETFFFKTNHHCETAFPTVAIVAIPLFI